HHVGRRLLEIGRDPLQDRRRKLGPVRLAVQLVPSRLAHARADPARLRPHLREPCARRRRVETAGRSVLARPFAPPEGPLAAPERLPQDAELLVQAHDLAVESFRRPEVDDLDRPVAPQPVEPADPLLDRPRVPGEIEEDDPTAELEVAALAAALGRDEDRRPRPEAELGHLDVGAPLGEVLVEDADAPPGRALEALLQPLERLAARD